MTDLVLKQVVATIDERTSVVCLHAAGDIVPVDQAFETLAGDFMEPPFHMYCRSLVQPWTPGMVNIMREQANAELQNRPLKERRLGPRGEIGMEMPPPSPANPPVGHSLSLSDDSDLFRPMALVGTDRTPAAYANALRDVREAAEEVAARTVPVLGGQEAAVLDEYLRSSHETINRVLRGGEISQGMIDRLVKRTGVTPEEAVEVLRKYLDRQDPLEHPIVVYRAMSLARFGDLREGMILKDPGFMSTSLSREEAERFIANTRTGGRVLAEFIVPRGHKVGAVNPLVEDGEGDLVDRVLGWEAEALLNSGQRFRVQSLTTDDDGVTNVVFEILGEGEL